jgi:CrcB protein
VFAGGCLGGLLRAALAQGLSHPPGRWPWATFLVNVIGTFLLGHLLTRLRSRPLAAHYLRPLLAAGLCGALTTFSTMMLELQQMLDAGHWALAGGYAAASVLCGLGALLISTRAWGAGELGR